MIKTLLSFLILIIAISFTFSGRKINLAFHKIFLKNEVHFTIGTTSVTAHFKKLTDSDVIKFDSELSRFKISRISDLYMSEDGKYVMTFAQTSKNQIKRIVFLYQDNQMIQFTDDVTDFSSDKIKTTNGLVAVIKDDL